MPGKRQDSFHTTVYGKYFLLERLAVGGMAEVFKAKTFGVRGFERLLVIKRILPHLSKDEDFIEMFIDEAKISVELSHANIVQVTDLGKIGDNFFIAMEYIDGKDLRAILKKSQNKNRPLSVEQAAFITIEMCKGLDYAHRKKSSTTNKPLNIIHRDISPQNIMISYDGEVKIVDFGIAKTASKLNQTQAGVLKGKFGYMSPEQASGLEVDQRTDIFSTGIMLFETLTGRRLFLGETDFETLEKIKEAKCPPPSKFNSTVPEELDRITLKALAREPSKRYQSIKELQVDLTRFFYSAYPDFTASNLGAYLKRLFRDEIKEERVRLKQSLGSLPIEGLIDSELASYADGQVIDSQGNDATAKSESDKKVLSQNQAVKLDLEPIAQQDRDRSNFLKSFSFYDKTVGRIFGKNEGSGEGVGGWLSSNKHLILGFLFLLILVVGIVKYVVPPKKPVVNNPAVPTKIPTIAAEKKDFKFISKPEGAKLYINKKFVGKTPLVHEVNLKEFITVGFKKDGFAPLERKIYLNSDDQIEQKFLLDPLKASKVSLLVSSTPSSAKIIINGKDTGKKTPSKIDGLSPEEKYSVELRLWGYKSAKTNVDLLEGKENKISMALAKLTSSLKISTSPTGAKISLEGFRERKSPTTFRGLKKGKTYKFTIYKNGYEPINKHIKISKFSTSLSYRLSKAVKDYGYISLNAVPYAEIILDGKLIGYTPKTNLKVTAGTHKVKFKHPTAPEITKTISVKKGKTETVIVQMEVRD